MFKVIAFVTTLVLPNGSATTTLNELYFDDVNVCDDTAKRISRTTPIIEGRVTMIVRARCVPDNGQLRDRGPFFPEVE